MKPRARILVFARPPVAGQAKTRLIPALGAEGAARLHARLTERTLHEVSEVPAIERELWCANDPDHPGCQDWSRRYALRIRSQRGADLGARMLHALDEALAATPCAVLIGTDSIDLCAADLEDAIDALQRVPVVLTPAADGGYLLVGLRRSVPAMFQGVDWGSDRVLEQTRACLRAQGRDWQELATRHDIDRPVDLALIDAARLGGDGEGGI